jgi:hypothetical protein
MAKCKRCNQEAVLDRPDTGSMVFGLLIGLTIGITAVTVVIGYWQREAGVTRSSYFQERIARGCRPVVRWIDGEVIKDKTCILPDGTVLSTQ